MGEKRLTPEMLNAVPETRGSIVAGHQVRIFHVPGARRGPRTGHYVVAVAGSQINARWKFRPIEVERLSRSLAQAIGRKGETHDGRYDLGAEVW